RVSAAPSAASAGRAGFGERLGGLARQAGRDLAYLSIGGLTAVLAFCVWVTAVSVTLSLIVFIIGLPIFLLSVIAFRWTAELDRRNAALLRGRPLRGTYRDHRGESFLARLASTTRDAQTWKDLAWLVAHSVLGFAFAVIAVSAVASVIASFVMPLWYWSIPGGVEWGPWNVDNLPLALVATVLSIPLAALAFAVDRGMAKAELWLAETLLDGDELGAGGRSAAGSPTLPLSTDSLRRAVPEGELSLALHAAISGMVGLLCTAIWAAAGGGYYWPAWVWLALVIPLSLHFGLREALRVAPERRGLAIQAVVSLVVIGITVAIWALAGFGTFWPIWTILGLIVLFLIVVLARLAWRRLYGDERERELTERVETLTETRRGALDVQAAELRRIERDLHDGAQARLGALSMQLGRAEEGLADRPEIAALVRRARAEATAANAELRDLARGIAPPVLSDRGLAAAVEALGTRAPIPVTVDARISRRPAPVVESAAYFVVAESLTNVAKHAPGARATVTLRLAGDTLDAVVADDGPGGAEVTAGGGLDGLRRRVAALDGELRVSSPPGAGTRIEVRLPCGS
ncbi:MAG TPA: sensor domain-containing protein, partial [Solirubrobacterales bacterium]|nr:sensor domain-containing protein [Solirubrobacterales bacterium]